MRRYPWSRSRCARRSCRGPRPGFRLRPRPVGGEYVRCRLRRPGSLHRQPSLSASFVGYWSSRDSRRPRTALNGAVRRYIDSTSVRRSTRTRTPALGRHRPATAEGNDSTIPSAQCRGDTGFPDARRRQPRGSAGRAGPRWPAAALLGGWTVFPVAARAQGLGHSHKLDRSIVIDKAMRGLRHRRERPNGYCAYSGRPSSCCCDSVGEGGVGWGVSGAM